MNERAILAAIVQGSEHERLYLANAWFKQGLDAFVFQMLPVFVRGLALEAAELGGEMQARIALIEGGLPSSPGPASLPLAEKG